MNAYAKQQNNSIVGESGQIALTDDTTCYVCGKDCAIGWFARIYEKRRLVYLCGTACALLYFDIANPPAHDHQARHQYYRVRAALLGASNKTEALSNESSGNNIEAISDKNPQFAP